ncbi:MAG: hypothetical protein EHM20_02530 [Alphaproteobacteria bacterium]|nr:MAG: hypothetical protein EHM20_02530 [Alphaproteobacteria bacterium]
MDTILVILNALKIDKTVIIQFVLLIVFFNTLAPLLFKRIQKVLELREGKTTKLESHAHAVYKKSEELAEQYKAKVEKTHQDSQLNTNKKKSDVLNKERDLLKSAEEKISAEYEERKAKILKEISEKRLVVMAEAEKLASNLVEKLTK